MTSLYWRWMWGWKVTKGRSNKRTKLEVRSHLINFHKKDAMNEEIAGKITAYRRGK
jgi:hypothetical protein